MKALRIVLLAAVFLAGAVASAAAVANGRPHHHPRARVGVFIGAPVLIAPFYLPYYYAPYYYPYYPPVYYAPAVVVPPPAPAYVEPQAAPQRADPYWYYCPAARAYFPYVQQCAGGWQRVVPQPPPPS